MDMAPQHDVTRLLQEWKLGDHAALDSLMQHVGQITHLMPVWLLLGPGGSGIKNMCWRVGPETRQDYSNS